jgi:hypothetical protein
VADVRPASCGKGYSGSARKQCAAWRWLAFDADKAILDQLARQARLGINPFAIQAEPIDCHPNTARRPFALDALNGADTRARTIHGL